MRISDWSSDVCSSDLRYVVVTGRAKDIIIRNGENIAPKEIEDLLLGHPQIAEVAIVGVPDARTGERAIAVIVPKRSEEHTSELQSLMRISYAVFCLKKKTKTTHYNHI